MEPARPTRPTRWTQSPAPSTRPSGVRRTGERVSWDHSVLESGRARLEWTPRQRVEQREKEGVRPFWILAVAWGLVGWSLLSAWGVWTRHDIDTHLSLRFLARGDIEEIIGLTMGLLWFVMPAGVAFWIARHARIVSRDTCGARAYWAAIVATGIAALGVFRPAWDQSAGSRFALGRSGPASAAATPPPPAQTAHPDEVDAPADPTANADNLGPGATYWQPGGAHEHGPWPQPPSVLGPTAEAPGSDGG